MTKVLNGFIESNYSYYYAAKQTVQGLFIILIMPRLKIHPSLFCIIALLLQTLRLLLSNFFFLFIVSMYMFHFGIGFYFYLVLFQFLPLCKNSLVKLSHLAEDPTTVKSRALTRVTTQEIKFFLKGHSKQTSNFPFINSL